MKLEAAATSDRYFIQRNLYPNVDFYSGIVMRAMGIPTSMFTVLFAVRDSLSPTFWPWRQQAFACATRLLYCRLCLKS